MYECMYIFKFICMYLCMYICLCIYLYIYIYTPIYICTYNQGNGVPIAAVITRRKIADKFVQKHGVFFSTFGGNPVCVAAAHAVLDVLQDTHVLARTAHAGEALRAAMSATTAAAALPSHVRGVGLMNCLELVTDHESQRPNTQLASCLKNALRRRGVLVGTTGQHSNMLKIRPPLAFTAAEVRVRVCVWPPRCVCVYGGGCLCVYISIHVQRNLLCTRAHACTRTRIVRACVCTHTHIHRQKALLRS